MTPLSGACGAVITGEAFCLRGLHIDRLRRRRCAARSHLDAFLDLFPLRDVRVFERGEVNRLALCKNAEALRLTVTDYTDPRQAIEGADIVVSSMPMSRGLELFLDTPWVKSGAYVNLIDLARTWRQETLEQFDCIIIEDAVQEDEMSPQMIPAELIAEDLQDLVRGRASGRRNDLERIAFVFRGLAIGDLAIAILAYERALKDKVGTYLPR